MGNTFPDFVHFRKTWRPSQAQILENAQKDMADGKFHLSAAPGSGKTTIGLELIRQLDQPALVLSPTTAISEQWKNRFKEDFLPEEEEARKWVSRDAAVAAPIISITYQSVFAAMNIGRPFLKWMRAAGIRTLCLDEAHHLRSEWWKTLEKLTSQMPELTILALTATPPYDATNIEWQRYLSMCGEIDREIHTPELVKEGSLCPHQDYLYFCYPEKDEAEQIRELRKAGEEGFARLLHDEKLTAAAQAHLGLAVPEAYEEFFLDNPAYFISLLCFLKENRVPIPAELLGMTGTEAVLPAMTVERMEIFLNGFFTYDRDSYEGAAEYQAQLEEELKVEKLIVRGKVNLTRPTEIRRILNAGKEKLAALETIVRAEMASMGEDLHMLILTDHIKKEQMPSVGDETKELKDIGALPVFEFLRRAKIEGLYLMVMTGTLMMIPDYLVPWFEEHTDLKWASVKETGYSRLQFTADCQAEAMKWMTLMFEEGYANVLIGTASLLGEGWDCPCVNTLVLATKVGSYMMTNQMRGRAIRTDRSHPDKVSNIWHVVSMDPDTRPQALRDFLKMMRGRMRAEPGAAEALADDGRISEDFEGMVRRFSTFMGVHYEKPVIENGLERLTEVTPPYTKAHLEEINRAMLKRASDRTGLKRQWEEAMDGTPERVPVVEEVAFEKKEFPKPLRWRNAVAWLVFGCFGEAVLFLDRYGTRLLRTFLGESWAFRVFLAGVILLAFVIRNYSRVLTKKLTPAGRMEQIAHGVMEALQDAEWIRSPDVNFAVEHTGEYDWQIYLKGGTVKEQKLFVSCLGEFLGPIDNPRYLIVEPLIGKAESYYPVPELFGKNKDDAHLFYRNMKEYMGDVILGYTRSGLGRKLLLKARFYSYGNYNEMLVRRKTVMKKKWE
jgi:superfamily II DNA or RNA helicase